MAFFEDLGKKVTQTGQEAIKKTKILAETTKLNTQISAEKRTISELHARIGEKYYELYGENPDGGLAEFITAIKDAEKKIEDFENQIKALRGVGTCPNCGAEIGEGTLFCPNCGTKVQEAPPEEPKTAEAAVRVCKNCGSQLSDTAQFCSGCGQKAD